MLKRMPFCNRTQKYLAGFGTQGTITTAFDQTSFFQIWTYRRDGFILYLDAKVKVCLVSRELPTRY